MGFHPGQGDPPTMKTLGQIVDHTRPLYTLSPETKVLEACHLMAEQGVGCVLILEKGRPVGIFTERDLLTRVVTRGLDASATALREVMTSELILGEESEPYLDAMAQMHDHNCRHLPICREGRLIGVLSMRDLLLAGVEVIKERLEGAARR